MPYPKTNFFHRRSKPQGPRANEKIRALDVQVINSEGKNLGVLPLNKAVSIAKEEGLDLIEISPNANPPVCKIMDFGKFKYDQQKPVTEIHDYNFKIKNAKKFISKGDKVKFTIKFKGREMQHLDIGKNLMNRIIDDTKDIAKVETQPKFEGKQMTMIIQPN